jgi:DNA-binding LacI/PurR family transcriptional regulator
MSEENLYINVKNKICDLIFNGTYKEGERIPAERTLAEKLEVSRVTLRKSLELLEQDNLIVREVGSGTRVCFHNYGTQSSMDMLVLIAPAKNPFFSEFIAHFQVYAEQKGSMLLYVEKPRMESLENCLYRLYKRGLQNVAVWLDDIEVNMEKLKRLRALGMNLVFFDTDKGIPYADCVALDNEKAIHVIFQWLKVMGYERIGYAGWNSDNIYSIAKREEAYLNVSGEKDIFLRLPWENRSAGNESILNYLRTHQDGLPEAIICSDRETGSSVSAAVEYLKLQVQVAAVDDFPEARGRGVVTYAQDLKESVRTIYQCLLEQNLKEAQWKAEVYLIDGIENRTCQ